MFQNHSRYTSKPSHQNSDPLEDGLLGGHCLDCIGLVQSKIHEPLFGQIKEKIKKEKESKIC